MADDKDQFSSKGAVEQDAPGEKTNENMSGQLGHRDQDPMLKSSDTDFPEPGNNEEHTGEPRARDTHDEKSERVAPGLDPGHRQKRNQDDKKDKNNKKDDPFAA